MQNETGGLRDDALLKLLKVASLGIVVSYGALLLPPDWVQFLAGREMVFEALGSAFFLLSSILFVRAWRAVPGSVDGRSAAGEARSRARWRRIAYALLALLLFVACGEELSWGQHWLGFETPDAIKQINAQDEVNLHNLWLLDSYDQDGGKKRGWQALLLNSNRLFDYFMVTLLWLLPWAHRLVPFLGGLIDRFGGPVVPRLLGLPLLLTFAATGLAETFLVDGMLSHLAVSEIREMTYAVLTALAAWSLWRQEGSAAEPSSNGA